MGENLNAHLRLPSCGSTMAPPPASDSSATLLSPATSTIDSDGGVTDEPTRTSTLFSVISLRAAVAAAVGSELSLSTVTTTFSPPIVCGHSLTVSFSGMPSGRRAGQRQDDADVDVGTAGDAPAHAIRHARTTAPCAIARVAGSLVGRRGGSCLSPDCYGPSPSSKPCRVTRPWVHRQFHEVRASRTHRHGHRAIEHREPWRAGLEPDERAEEVLPTARPRPRDRVARARRAARDAGPSS